MSRLASFGVHTPLQDTSVGAIRALWSHIDRTPCFDWISVWDHLGNLSGQPHNLEAVAMHAALAMSTTRVQCACLVYSVGYRPPLVLADAVATIDHLSGGRAVLGLGAGYLAAEYTMQGVELPSAHDRVDQLRETVVAIRQLFAGDEVSMDGDHVRLVGARCAPTPLQERLPIVIGGGGEQATIPLAARLADGWNVPMATPPDAARKIGVLRRAQSDAGREPGAVMATLNVGLCFDRTLGPERYGARWPVLGDAVLGGSNAEVIDAVAAYADAGADRIVLSVRAPFDAVVTDELDRFAEEIVPAFVSGGLS